MLAKYSFDGSSFALIIQWSAGSVRINIINLLRSQGCVFESHKHTARRASAIFRWRGDMVSVIGHSITGNLGQNVRPTRLRIIPIF